MRASELRPGQFNIDNEVKVKLTAEALAIHRRKFEELHKTYPHALGDYEPPLVDANGWSKFQLWQLMHDFGPHMFCGSDQLFEGNVIWFGWDDEQQSDYKLPDGFTRYDGSGKPNLPDYTEVEFSPPRSRRPSTNAR